MPEPSIDRGRDDLCPGILKPFSAEDGAIIRLRAPGGRVSVAVLRTLASLSPSGFVQLTSRGNLQVRALPDPVPAAVEAAVLATGLVPSTSHERVRNIVCSPLTGLSGGLADVRPVVAEIDRLLCADPLLAGLPGRMLFAVDDGRGDMVTEPFDLAVVVASPTRAEIRQRGHDLGLRVALHDAPAAVIALARAFQQTRVLLSPTPWHVRELPEPLQHPDLDKLDAVVAGPQPRPGEVDGHLVVGVPLAHLTLPMLDALDAATDEVVVTPWRSLVVPDGARRTAALAAAGFAVEACDPWSSISACTGLPGCRRSAIATLPMAREVVERLGRAPRLPIHLSGCDRRCGAPRRDHHDLVAPRDADAVLAAVEQSEA
ncbi:nitrite/sulfite reductase [Mariniluteicoccus endophyticus]